MTKYTIALIEGDGIGPEISKAALKVIEATEKRFDLNLEIRASPAGDRCLEERGKALPDESIAVIQNSDACLKGPVGDTAADVIVRLRQMLNLYANIRPSKSLPNVESLKPGIDLVIVRENTEDLYRGQEFDIEGGVVSLRLITRSATQRIAEYAFKLAENRGRLRSVLSVHKSNVLRKSDGLFSQVCREQARRFPSIAFSEMLVDSAAMNLIRTPESFDVIVTTNLYGDILSDEAAQLVGGLGLAPSSNIGEKFALFEAVHGSAPDIAGKGIANPIAMVLSAAMMLEWLATSRNDSGCADAAARVRSSVNAALERGIRTPDLGGTHGTLEVGNAIADEISRK